MNRLVVGAVIGALLTTAERSLAADDIMPTKAPPAASYGWTGFYVGAHLGYAAGSSGWSASPAGGGAPTFAGSFDLFNSFNAFTGTGSYSVGLQGGYNYMLPSRVVLGVEADASFPSLFSGTTTLSSASIGTASYSEQVQFFGTMRGRVGYAPGSWLFYATGGFAWSYDQFSRTQLAGVPTGGAAMPGEIERLTGVPRVGGVLGAGVELALTPRWTARLEYLFTDYGMRSITFPDAAQRFTSDLAVQSLRLGLDYQLGKDAISSDVFTKGVSALDGGWYVVHGDMNFVEQYVPSFRSPYAGTNSLAPNQARETWDYTFAAGFKLWRGAELWIDPEIDQGFGLSNTEGVAGFPSGAAFKVGAAVPYARIQRTFLRQTIDLGGATQKVDADLNQFAGSPSADRLVVTVGKFSVSDVFDTNKYAQNPRKDFMNWALIDAGSFDYAADAWGYSYGASVEWYQGNWTLRGGLFDLSVVPNSTELDPTFSQVQWLGEIERRYDLWSHPGKIAVTGFLSRARMGTYTDAIAFAAITGGPAEMASVRQYRSRPGIDMNLEQEITSELGVFMRAGLADGAVEPFDYTDIDRTIAVGMALTGKQWGRPDDMFGLAGIVNGISSAHAAFLNDGGLGILVGDGMLPHPGLEQIIETYYKLPLHTWNVTFDYQFIVNPAYNRDRGPVSVIGTRLHTQF